MSISCLLIGQDNLLIQCGTFLLENNHHIKWVVSQFKPIQLWCEKNHISWISSFSELPPNSAVDYIFSIVNGKILKSEDLRIAHFGAINYHDSLLPKYAGVNATTWAILNGETTHGITWHMVTTGIDEGDIVYQTSFPILPTDTAFTLNLRCFEAATIGFAEIIRKITTSSLTYEKQQKAQRSYYGIKHVLPDLGFINWQTANANYIERLSRALNLGGYDNNVVTLKLLFQDSYLLVSDIEIVELAASSAAGKILAIKNNGILVSTNTQPILIKTFMTTERQIIKIAELVQHYKLHENYQFPFLDDSQLRNTHALYSSALHNEKYWQSKLTDLIEHTTFSERVLNSESDYIELQPISFDFDNSSDASLYLFVTVLLYLFRTNNYENFTTFISHPISLDKGLYYEIFTRFLPFTTELSSELSCAEFLDKLRSDLDTLRLRSNYLQDIFVRHPSLSLVNEEQQITIGFSSDDLPRNSLIHFDIEQTTQKLRIYHRLDNHFQDGALSLIIENISNHLNNILNQLIKNPQQSIHEFSFLTEDEEKKLLRWGVGEHLPLPSNTINELFEHQVKHSPQKIAIYLDNDQLTYKELWTSTEKIAAFIHTLHLPQQTAIGVYTEQSANLLASFFGILKANCICIPIDTNLSVAELNAIIKENNISQLITSKNYASRLSENLADDCINRHDIETILSQQISALQNIPSTQSNLTHKNIINYCYWFTRATHFTHESVLDVPASSQTHLPLLATPLLVGGALSLCDQYKLKSSPQHFLQYLHKQNISHTKLSSEAWEILLDYPHEIRQLNQLRYLLLPEQVKNTNSIAKWSLLCPNSKFRVMV